MSSTTPVIRKELPMITPQLPASAQPPASPLAARPGSGLGRTVKRHAGKGIAILATGVATATVLTASAGAATSGGTTTLRLTAKAATTVFVDPCRTCVTSVPAGIHTGAVANQSGTLINGQGTLVGHFAQVATVVSPQGELVVDVTLVLGQDQITAHGIEEPPANGGTIAITGGTGRYQSAGGEIRFRDTNKTGTVTQVQAVIDR